MAPLRSGLAALALASLVCLAGGAIADDGEPSLQPLTTADPGEEVPAGVPVTLGWMLANADGEPAFHQDARFEVRFENKTLLATTPASGHDYDGVDPYQVAFPGPGSYEVRAAVHDDGEVREVTYEGRVGPAPEDALRVEIETEEQVRAGQPTAIGVAVTGPGGEPVGEAEVSLRVQRGEDRFEVLKTRLADDDGRPEVRYAFARTGTFHVTAVATPLPGAREPLAAAAATTEIAVEGPAEPARGTPVEQPLVNDRETGEDEAPYELFGTYDPYTSVGPHGRVRLGMLTLNETTHAPVRDVDYAVSILDPEDRQILHADSLRAADGFEYVTLSRPDPGTYTARVDATKGDWHDRAVLEFTVVPPAGATNAGPLLATPNASTSLEAGTTQTFPVHVEDQAGVPLTHGEVDFRFVDEAGVPAATGKLHVHENGTLPVALTPLSGGDHRLELFPQSLQPAPTPYTYGEEVGQPPVFDVDVAPLEAAGDPAGQGETGEANDAPGLAAPLVVLVLAGLAVVRRR